MSSDLSEPHPGEWRTADERIEALCMAGEVKLRSTAPTHQEVATYSISDYSSRFFQLTLIKDDHYHPEAARISVESAEFILNDFDSEIVSAYGRRIVEISIEPESGPVVICLDEARGQDGIWQELNTRRLSATEATNNPKLRRDIAEIARIVLTLSGTDRTK